MENKLLGITNLLTEEYKVTGEVSTQNIRVRDALKADMVKVEREITECKTKMQNIKTVLAHSQDAILEYPVFL